MDGLATTPAMIKSSSYQSLGRANNKINENKRRHLSLFPCCSLDSVKARKDSKGGGERSGLSRNDGWVLCEVCTGRACVYGQAL